MKNYAYIRVSTNIQESSLEVQQSKILDYCRFKGLEQPKFLIDEDVSGGKPILQRPAGSKLISIKDSNIIAVKFDRLFRSVVDALTMSELWKKDNNIIHLADEDGMALNTETANGWLVYTFKAMLGEFERRQVSERTATALQHKKKTGKVYTGEIFGFDKKDGDLIENKEEMKWVKRMFFLRSEKYSLQFIADELNGLNVRPKNNGSWYPSTISYILKNPIYKKIK